MCSPYFERRDAGDVTFEDLPKCCALQRHTYLCSRFLALNGVGGAPFKGLFFRVVSPRWLVGFLTSMRLTGRD